jgi:hypothetical protein
MTEYGTYVIAEVRALDREVQESRAEIAVLSESLAAALADYNALRALIPEVIEQLDGVRGSYLGYASRTTDQLDAIIAKLREAGGP